jgi:hypothetical protein
MRPVSALARARLPLFDLAPCCVPFGQGVIVLGLVSEAEDSDGIRTETVEAPDCRPSQHRLSNEAGQIVDAGHGEPVGRDGKGTFTHGGTLVAGAPATLTAGGDRPLAHSITFVAQRADVPYSQS